LIAGVIPERTRETEYRIQKKYYERRTAVTVIVPDLSIRVPSPVPDS
jgi:hypothetical protein